MLSESRQWIAQAGVTAAQPLNPIRRRVGLTLLALGEPGCRLLRLIGAGPGTLCSDRQPLMEFRALTYRWDVYRFDR